MNTGNTDQRTSDAAELGVDLPHSNTKDRIAALQSEIEILRKRVKVVFPLNLLFSPTRKLQELENENAELSHRVSNCRCFKEEDIANVINRVNLISEKEELKAAGDIVVKKKSKRRASGFDMNVMHQFTKRYVALKIMYFGQRFYGFASEAQMDPTVESEVFKALEKTRLIFGDRKGLRYSRCGRTDKGVSSVGQVIALFLRSNNKEQESGKYCGEIDYVRILNKVLPKDIRVIGWSAAPVDFSARFSCLNRVYKYFFWKEDLNIMAMETAGRKFVGEHDFRNFCKMDAANVHNYRRHITLFEIIPCNERFDSDQLWAMKIKGSAFLWHQVRCMVAVLFLIGHGLESPNVIDTLLDIHQIQRKPQYLMAPEIPLVLQSCEFEDLDFRCSSDAKQALRLHLEKECRTYKLQATIYHEALLSSSLIETDANSFNETRKKVPQHVPLLSRLTEPSYEERRVKINSGAVPSKSATSYFLVIKSAGTCFNHM